ncbi:MAG: hypothetical protein V9E94_13395 [Microthrixaceae bacterium]
MAGSSGNTASPSSQARSHLLHEGRRLPEPGERSDPAPLQRATNSAGVRRSSWPYSGRVPDDELRIEPAGPARALAVLLVVAAVALVTIGTLRGGLERAADDPVPPWTIAVLTVLGGLVLAWRALTQSVVIGGDGLVIRNVSSTSEAPLVGGRGAEAGVASRAEHDRGAPAGDQTTPPPGCRVQMGRRWS